jgi:hypothetical protein
MTVKDLLTENYNETLEPGEREILDIFKDVKMGDVMIGYMTGNYAFLDNLHGSIREGLNNSIRNLSLDTLTTRIVDSMLPIFDPLDLKNLVKDGEDVLLVAKNELSSFVN